MAKVPGLYLQPDGRHWHRKPQVYQLHPLQDANKRPSFLFDTKEHIKLIPMTISVRKAFVPREPDLGEPERGGNGAERHLLRVSQKSTKPVIMLSHI